MKTFVRVVKPVYRSARNRPLRNMSTNEEFTGEASSMDRLASTSQLVHPRYNTFSVLMLGLVGPGPKRKSV